MSRLEKLEGKIFRLMLIMWIVLTQAAFVPMRKTTQGSTYSPWVVRSIYTSEYGINAPQGLAYSPNADTFLVLDGSANLTLISMGGDSAGARNVPDAQNDPMNVAFDKKSNSLWVLKSSKSELAQVKADEQGLPKGSAASARFGVGAFGIKDPQGIALDSGSGRLFILDAGKSQILAVTPHSTMEFDPSGAMVQRISLKELGGGIFRGIAINPSNGHLYISEIGQKKLYELTQAGDWVVTYDLASLGINDPRAMTFAPSVDNTDDPNRYDLFVLDSGQGSQSGKVSGLARPISPQGSTSSSGQIVELSLIAAASLPPGTTLLPSTLVRTFDTSSWTHPSPDPSGIDYWPLTGQFLIDDSEIEESVGGNPPVYWHGFNIFQSTLAGGQTGNCTTFTSDPVNNPPTWNNYSNEPTGLAINPNNNHIFISNDGSNSRVFEVSPGQDGTYCTSDDVVTRFVVATLYGATDAEDVAYGNNTLFIADGVNAEVYVIPLGANGVLNGGGDDGPMTHFDTAALGFNDLEGIGYNSDAGTLFIVSTVGSENYLGEVTTTGTLVHAYDLSFMGTQGNIRSDVVYAPASQNPAVKNIYIVSRGVDNNNNRFENDGKVWEIGIAASATSTPTNTPTAGPSPTPTPTSTRTPTPTFTPTASASGNPLYVSFTGGGSVGGVSFADEDILKFDGSTWSLFFDGSDVGLTSADVLGFHLLDADSLLLTFNTSITLGGVTYAPTDIVRFNATSLGTNTAGTFSMYFNGVDVGLSASTENIDAMDVLSDGKILISTTGTPTVPGLSGLADEDILAFTPQTLGNNTSGTWALYFDGSDVGLADSSQEDVDALSVDPNGNIYLSTLGDFSVSGVAGFDEDVFVCTPTSLGSVTACNYSSTLYFDGSTWGLAANDVDGFSWLSTGPNPTATPTNTPTLGPSSTPTNTPTNTPTPSPTNTPTSGPSPTPTNTPTNTPTPTATFTSTNTPTPTNTSAVSDLIFADGFESGNFSAWTSSTTDLGDLSVSPSAALVAAQGMQAVINDVNTIYVTDDSPNAEPRYRARFYFDPNSITMASGNAHFIFKGFMGTSNDVLQVEFSYTGSAYQLRARLLNDSAAFVSTSSFTISDAPHSIEVDWQAATAAGANNGSLTFWIDGVQQAGLTGVDNDTLRIDRVRLGGLSGIDTGTLGTYFFDAFESRRQTYIGP